MKAVFIFIIFSLFLVGCGVEFGQNYKHLQDQDISKLHEVDVTGDTNRNIGNAVSDEKSLYDSLNDNLCDLEPACCGRYTDEQKDFRDLEKRAIFEKNRMLCFRLPADDFVISCGNDLEDDIILYSRTRCLEVFED